MPRRSRWHPFGSGGAGSIHRSSAAGDVDRLSSTTRGLGAPLPQHLAGVSPCLGAQRGLSFTIDERTLARCHALALGEPLAQQVGPGVAVRPPVPVGGQHQEQRVSTVAVGHRRGPVHERLRHVCEELLERPGWVRFQRRMLGGHQRVDASIQTAPRCATPGGRPGRGTGGESCRVRPRMPRTQARYQLSVTVRGRQQPRAGRVVDLATIDRQRTCRGLANPLGCVPVGHAAHDIDERVGDISGREVVQPRSGLTLPRLELRRACCAMLRLVGGDRALAPFCELVEAAPIPGDAPPAFPTPILVAAPAVTHHTAGMAIRRGRNLHARRLFRHHRKRHSSPSRPGRCAQPSRATTASRTS